MEKSSKKNRYHLLDVLRGANLISMILYHGTWDLVYLYGVDWKWYHGDYAYIWQQSICWIFILLSGFCWNLGKHHLKRGLMVFGGGMIITIATMLFMWDSRVIFGVLTLLGTCMLLMIPLHTFMKRWNPWVGLAGSGILFLLTRNINSGCLGFEGWNLFELPGQWYQGYIATFLGFCDPAFYSTDYFSLLPWGFLFLAGYFLYQGFVKQGLLSRNKALHAEGHADKKNPEGLMKILQIDIPPLSFIGQHSLIIYMLHQVVLFVILQTVFGKW